MSRKILSLMLSFLLAFTSAWGGAAGEMSSEDIAVLLSKPKSYSKKPEALLAMAVLAGMPQCDKIIQEFLTLENKIAEKEKILKAMQDKRVFQAGADMMIELKKGYSLNFPALDDYYKSYKANVYDPAFEELKRHRLAYLENYKSSEVRERYQAAENKFAAIKKEYLSLQRQWKSAQETLLKTNIPNSESALRKEISSLKKSLGAKRNVFAAAQYKLFKEEYSSLVSRLRGKAGLFLPRELDNFLKELYADLLKLEKASGKEELAAARRGLNKTIEGFGGISSRLAGKEVKFYKESLNKFFLDLSKRLNLKGTTFVIAAGGIVLLMLSAQSASSAGGAAVSNRRVSVSRSLSFCYDKTPELMLANAIALQDIYGVRIVADVIYENQKYIPLMRKQSENLKFLNDNFPKRDDMMADIVVSSYDYQLPVNFDFSF